MLNSEEISHGVHMESRAPRGTQFSHVQYGPGALTSFFPPTLSARAHLVLAVAIQDPVLQRRGHLKLSFNELPKTSQLAGIHVSLELFYVDS